MICFDYKPIYDEDEKVYYQNGQVIVEFENDKRILDEKDITNIKLDKLWDKRSGLNDDVDGIIKSLYAMDSDDQKEKDKYKLFVVEPKDEIDISFEAMMSVFKQLNYDSRYSRISFDYIAYGD